MELLVCSRLWKVREGHAPGGHCRFWGVRVPSVWSVMSGERCLCSHQVQGSYRSLQCSHWPEGDTRTHQIANFYLQGFLTQIQLQYQLHMNGVTWLTNIKVQFITTRNWVRAASLELWSTHIWEIFLPQEDFKMFFFFKLNFVSRFKVAESCTCSVSK